jgi:hypothetical protein
MGVPIARLTTLRVRGRDNPWLVVSNDTYNLRTGFVQGLELVTSPSAYPETTVAAEDATLREATLYLGSTLGVFAQNPASKASAEVVEEQLGSIIDPAFDKIDAHIAAIFGL